MADSATTPAVKNTVELEADVNVEFNEAASRQQINSGESVKTLFGKLRKFLTDLKAVAFTGAYSDLSGTPDLSRYASKSKYGDTTINVGRKAGTTVGSCSTAEGSNTTASGICSHAESGETTASGDFSHAEGLKTTAAQSYTHTEGYNTSSNAPAAHAEGYSSIAAGQAAHAEGQGTQAAGNNSHSGGYGASSFNNSSFSHGIYTVANKDAEIAVGKYNKSSSNTLFSVGDGTADDARHNSFEITTTGGKLHDKDIAVIDDIPSELPANGGNADTVDGKHASDFIPISGGTLTGSIVTPANDNMGIIPATNNCGQIGSSDKKFFRMYASTFYGALSGNATTATTATKLSTSSAGSATQPVYFSSGKPVACTYTLGKSVPADAVFTDTVPTSLPANGGNSDTVDGVHISCTNDAASGSNWFAAFTNGSNLRAIDPARAYVGNAGNADTVDNLHAWNMATLSAGGGSHGTSYPMYCQHNVLGDGRFYIGVGNGYERSVAVGYAETAGSVPVNAIIKSASFTVTTNSSGWNTLGITYPAYNIIGYQCNTSDYRVELYKGNSATEWYVYAIQQYPNPGVVATNKAVSVTIFYI